MIKILFVSHEYSVNGSTHSLLSMIDGIKAVYNKSVEITVLIPWKWGKSATAGKLLQSNKIKYKQMLYRNDYKYVNRRTSIINYVHNIWNSMAVKRMRCYIKKNEFDIVCSNSSAVDVGARAALYTNTPHIYYVREFMEDDFGFEFRNKKRMKELLESSDNIIFISKAIEKKYKSLYKLKNTVQFFNGFILQDYYIEEHDILKEKVISFVQVGTFAEGKGTINTIELLINLKRSGTANWHMEFVGNGTKEYVKKMRELITKYKLESQITISEYCLDIKKKLSQKDILIMNSRAEGFGRVTVEGMLAGCLVVGRYSGGTAEIIIDEMNGMTFGTKEEFLDVMHRIAAERGKYRELAKKGQKYALDVFDCSNTAKNFMKVVEECLEQEKNI